MRRFIALLCLSLFAFAAAHAQQIVRVEPVLTPDGRLEISADVELTLNSALRESVSRGVALYFTAELEIHAPRWWWFDRQVLTRTRTWRIAYNALTRQWLVRIDEVAWPVASLNEAMRLVTHIRGWSVAEVGAFDAGSHYRGRLRLRLDTSQLARPFQVHALNSSAWSLEAPWTRFSFALADRVRPDRSPSSAP